MRVEAKQVLSPKQTEQVGHKASSRTRDDPQQGTEGETNFVRGKSRGLGREPGSLRAVAGSARGRASPPVPSRRGPALGSPALSGTAGRSWPQPPPRLAPSRDGLAPPHVPRAGALSCSAPPPPGTGRRADRDPVSAPRAAPHPSEAPALLPQWHDGSSPTLW